MAEGGPLSLREAENDMCRCSRVGVLCVVVAVKA